MRNIQLALIISIMFLLTACGGGGSDSGSEGGGKTTPTALDTDGDGIADNEDTDDDNDGVVDAEDAFPLNSEESLDSDGDGIGNNADLDDDNDGVTDELDAFPLDETESLDSDGDGIGDNSDNDADNDGVTDDKDEFPLDSTESVDTDKDGVGDNADFYANNAVCAKESDGNGDDCYLTLMKDDDKVVLTHKSDQYLFIYSEALNKILKFDPSENEFTANYNTDSSKQISSLTYDKRSNKLYYAYQEAEETRFFDQSGNDLLFATESEIVRKVTLAGNYLLVQSGNQVKTYDVNGVEQYETWYHYTVAEHFWNAKQNKLFHGSGNANDNRFYTIAIDQESGRINSSN